MYSKEADQPRPPKCNLGHLQSKKIDPEQMKKQGWKEKGILVIGVDDKRLSWPEREFIKQIGNKIYTKTKINEVGNAK